MYFLREQSQRLSIANKIAIIIATLRVHGSSISRARAPMTEHVFPARDATRSLRGRYDV